MKIKELKRHLSSNRFRQLYFLPSLLILFLSFITFIQSIPKNFFWADDFGNLAAFSSKFGSLSDFTVNAGRPILNIFFFLMGTYFGTGSSFPYIVMSSLICLLGLTMIFLSLIRLKIITKEMSIFILSMLFASLSLWPILFWSTNITHGASIFLFGSALILCNLNHRWKKYTAIALAVEGLSLGLVILCNPLYIGVSTIFAVTRIILQYRESPPPNRVIHPKVALYLFLAVVWPILYFFTISQPNQSKNIAYAGASIGNILGNLRFYSHGLNEFGLCLSFFIFCLLLIFTRPNWLDLALLGAGASVLLPVLLQSSQRALNYLVLPIICFGSVLSRSFTKLFESKSRYSLVASILILGMPVISFDQTSDIRAWYRNPGLGSEAKDLLKQVNNLVPDNSNLCVSFRLEQNDENFIIAGISGESGFEISPVNSTNTLLDRYSPCLDDINRTQILITRGDMNQYIAKIIE